MFVVLFMFMLCMALKQNNFMFMKDARATNS